MSFNSILRLLHARQRYAFCRKLVEAGGTYKTELSLKVFDGSLRQIFDTSSGQSMDPEAIFKRNNILRSHGVYLAEEDGVFCRDRDIDRSCNFP
jgi:hypothetical protein